MSMTSIGSRQRVTAKIERIGEALERRRKQLKMGDKLT
jgi:hypothetical protein